jgi:predicted acetyltransferase
VVVEVEDRFCPWNGGRYLLEVSGGRGSCTRTDADPDLAVSVNVLGAAYLGGTTFRQSARGLQVRELRPGALAEVDAMFAWDPAPWCPFMF